VGIILEPNLIHFGIEEKRSLNATSCSSPVPARDTTDMKRSPSRSDVSILRQALSAASCRDKIRRSSFLKRDFTTTPGRRLRTSELSSSQLKDLKANADRLWNDIHHTAQWGTGKPYGERPEATGMSRLSLSDADRRARDWFVETTKSLSCKTHVDEIGNVFAIRPGLDNSKPATFAGSHLDTQPTGGRFDSVLGVCAGIEMLRVLEENWIETEGPVGVVNWTNEEGKFFQSKYQCCPEVLPVWITNGPTKAWNIPAEQ
jgi:hypothetical protein